MKKYKHFKYTLKMKAGVYISALMMTLLSSTSVFASNHKVGNNSADTGPIYSVSDLNSKNNLMLNTGFLENKDTSFSAQLGQKIKDMGKKDIIASARATKIISFEMDDKTYMAIGLSNGLVIISEVKDDNTPGEIRILENGMQKGHAVSALAFGPHRMLYIGYASVTNSASSSEWASLTDFLFSGKVYNTTDSSNREPGSLQVVKLVETQGELTATTILKESDKAVGVDALSLYLARDGKMYMFISYSGYSDISTSRTSGMSLNVKKVGPYPIPYPSFSSTSKGQDQKNLYKVFFMNITDVSHGWQPQSVNIRGDKVSTLLSSSGSYFIGYNDGEVIKLSDYTSSNLKYNKDRLGAMIGTQRLIDSGCGSVASIQYDETNSTLLVMKNGDGYSNVFIMNAYQDTSKKAPKKGKNIGTRWNEVRTAVTDSRTHTFYLGIKDGSIQRVHVKNGDINQLEISEIQKPGWAEISALTVAYENGKPVLYVGDKNSAVQKITLTHDGSSVESIMELFGANTPVAKGHPITSLTYLGQNQLLVSTGPGDQVYVGYRRDEQDWPVNVYQFYMRFTGGMYQVSTTEANQAQTLQKNNIMAECQYHHTAAGPNPPNEWKPCSEGDINKYLPKNIPENA